MCLYIKKTDKPEIADKDIVCYKAIQISTDLNGQFEYCSPFKQSPIGLGTQYDSILGRTKSGTSRFLDSIEEGIHSCASVKEASIIATTGELRTRNEYRVVKCIIPKGATYYKGYFSIDPYTTIYLSNLEYADELLINSYASDTIIYTDELVTTIGLISLI